MNVVPVKYVRDNYDNFFGVAKFNGTNLVCAESNVTEADFYSTAMQHSISAWNFLSIGRPEIAYHIFVESLGDADPLTPSAAIVTYTHHSRWPAKEVKDHTVPCQMVYSPNESYIRLCIRCITNAINCIHHDGNPIIIHSSNMDLVKLLDLSNCIKFASNNWQQGALPVEAHIELRKYLFALNNRKVSIMKGPAISDAKKMLKNNKPKRYLSTNAMYLRQF